MAKYSLGNNNDHFNGTQYDDEIYGNGGADYIHALDGNDFVNAGIGDDSIAGGRGNDWLLGGEGTDTINGEEGNDTIRDQAGNDTYYGGDDDDYIEGGHGDDHVYGQDGNDVFVLVGDGHVWMNGGTGNDTYRLAVPDDGWERPTINENTGEGVDLIELSGSWGKLIDSYTMPANVEGLTLMNPFRDFWFESFGYRFSTKTVYGNDQGNLITGSGAEDILHGGKGNDTLVGNGGEDMLFGDEGDDTLIDASGISVMAGGLNDDVYIVKSADVAFEPWRIQELRGQGYDTLKTDLPSLTMPEEIERLVLTGTDGSQVFANGLANLINGSSGGDEIHGGSGDDLLYGYGGNDSLIGDAGSDLLVGDLGDDGLVGGSGNDVLDGGEGSDGLWGGDGADRLNGGAGNDVLHGGAGADQLTGGAGSDKFYFSAAGESTMLYGVDRITDFTPGSDRIDLHALDADSTSAGIQNFHLVPAFSGQAGELMSKVLGDSTMVYADLNGDRVADMQVALTGVFTLTASDFDGAWG